jgi:hypothetical protein
MDAGLQTLVNAPAAQQGYGAYGVVNGAPVLNAAVFDQMGGNFGNIHRDTGLGWGVLEGSPYVTGVRSGAELLGAKRFTTAGAEGSDPTTRYEGLEAAASRLGIDPTQYTTARYTTGEGGAQEQIGTDTDYGALWNAIGQDPRLKDKYLVTANRQGWGEGALPDAPQEDQYARVMYRREGDRLVPMAAPETFRYDQQSFFQEAAPIVGMLATPFGGLSGMLAPQLSGAIGSATGLGSLASNALSSGVVGGISGALSGGGAGRGFLSGALGSVAGDVVGNSDFVQGMGSEGMRDFTTSAARNVAASLPYGGNIGQSLLNAAVSAGTRSALNGARSMMVSDMGMSPAAASRAIAMAATAAPALLRGRDLTPQQIISLATRVAAAGD